MDSIPYERLMEIACGRQRPTLQELKVLDSNLQNRRCLLELMDMQALFDEFNSSLLDEDTDSQIADSLDRTGVSAILNRALDMAFPQAGYLTPAGDFVLKKSARAASNRAASMALQEPIEVDADRVSIEKWSFEARIDEFANDQIVGAFSIVRLSVELLSDGSLSIEPQGEIRHNHGYSMSVKMRRGETNEILATGDIVCLPFEFDPVILILPGHSRPETGDCLDVQYQSRPPVGSIHFACTLRFP